MDDDALREQTLTVMMDEATKLESDDDRREFRALAESMIERHRQMFPEMHQRTQKRRTSPAAKP